MRKRAESECLAGLTSAACLYFSILTSCVEEEEGSVENLNEISLMATGKRSLGSPRKVAPSHKRGRSKRNRSVSESVAERNANLQGGPDDCSRYYTADYAERFRRIGKSIIPAGFRPNKKYETKDKFPFSDLPEDCKLKIFSYLSPTERVQATQVCSEWNTLLRDPSLWHDVDLRDFPLCNNENSSHVCGQSCYSEYRHRMKNYLNFLQTIRPNLKSLCFAFDIGDSEDRWLDSLENFLCGSRLTDLEVAYLNWKETPARPFWLEQMMWSNHEQREFMQLHRGRQRKFVNFFDRFTLLAPNVRNLAVPFDWSPRSLKCLARLEKLETLTIERYFVFQTLSNYSLATLFEFVPHLRRLVLEVWTPTGQGLQLYHINTPDLQYLDVSQCRGFYIGSVDLPSLKVFKISRHPWNGPLLSQDSANIPCIYDVLRKGAPKLKVINGHHLHATWRYQTYPDLDDILQEECSCAKHKRGWCM